jgi:hypothetical protein
MHLEYASAEAFFDRVVEEDRPPADVLDPARATPGPPDPPPQPATTVDRGVQNARTERRQMRAR